MRFSFLACLFCCEDLCIFCYWFLSLYLNLFWCEDLYLFHYRDLNIFFTADICIYSAVEICIYCMYIVDDRDLTILTPDWFWYLRTVCVGRDGLYFLCFPLFKLLKEFVIFGNLSRMLTFTLFTKYRRTIYMY